MSPALVFVPQRLLGYFLGGNTTNFFISAADGTVFPDVPNNMRIMRNPRSGQRGLVPWNTEKPGDTPH
jgi:hypothetical protein